MDQPTHDVPAARLRRGRGMPYVAAALAVGVGVSLFALVHERNQARTVATEQARTSTALTQARRQIQQLSARLDNVTESLDAAKRTTPAESARRPEAVTRRTAAARPSVRRAPRESSQYKSLQSQLSEQQRELESTRDSLEQARHELEGNLDSTRMELNGSIAKTHDELVNLEKRGERNYYEFHLTKSKNFQRVGPFSLALHKTNTKHQFYDVAMLVDDKRLDKKHVNLYEPVWLTLGDRPQPVELVVNRIGKSEIGGYISAPKYTKADLAQSNTPDPAQTADSGKQLIDRSR